MELLRVEDMVAGYGGIVAVKGIDLSVNTGEIVTLIGSNGAGKSTTLRAISGLIRTRSGRITYRDLDIHRLPAHQIVSLGISQVPEGRGIFQRLTVIENLRLGAFQRRDHDIESDLEKVFELFPRLKEREKQTGGTLSGGEQQMLAISRSLMSRPKLLMLDEPSLGLAPRIVDQVFELLVTLREWGLTILVVEQNANEVLEFADRAYVLASGSLKFSGSAQELLESGDVMEMYLGLEGH